MAGRREECPVSKGLGKAFSREVLTLHLLLSRGPATLGTIRSCVARGNRELAIEVVTKLERVDGVVLTWPLTGAGSGCVAVYPTAFGEREAERRLRNAGCTHSFEAREHGPPDSLRRKEPPLRRA